MHPCPHRIEFVLGHVMSALEIAGCADKSNFNAHRYGVMHVARAFPSLNVGVINDDSLAFVEQILGAFQIQPMICTKHVRVEFVNTSDHKIVVGGADDGIFADLILELFCARAFAGSRKTLHDDKLLICQFLLPFL